jgi:hypothetical protein
MGLAAIQRHDPSVGMTCTGNTHKSDSLHKCGLATPNKQEQQQKAQNSRAGRSLVRLYEFNPESLLNSMEGGIKVEKKQYLPG